MPRWRHRRALPLAPDQWASRRGALRGQRALPSSRAGSHVASEDQWRAGWGDVGPVGSSPPVTYVTPVGVPLQATVPTSPSTPARPYRSNEGAPSQGTQGRSGAPLRRPPPVGPQDRGQCLAEGGEGPVVDAAVIQLTGELAEQPRPVSRGTRISIRRSTTCATARPEFAARLCSKARCRQVAEHHLRIGPRLRGMIGPPHLRQVVAAMRRSEPEMQDVCGIVILLGVDSLPLAGRVAVEIAGGGCAAARPFACVGRVNGPPGRPAWQIGIDGYGAAWPGVRLVLAVRGRPA